MSKLNDKYSYVSHPDNWPLELSGSSKKKTNSLKKEDFNECRGNLHEESRSMLMKKLTQGQHGIDYVKSVVPE